ncbi:MAG: hypothetical protein LBB67_01910, partial [Oscillospiraceae bacterium]|nr:hypothetical protein [Oscillospiraceae bacterium]
MKRILRKSVGILLIVSMLAGMFGSTLASAKTVSQLSAAAHDALNHFIASVDAIEAANAFGQWEFTPGGEDNATNPAGGYNAVIADNTSAGLFLNAAKAFWALMKTDIVRMDHPTHGISDDDAKAFPYNWWAQMYYSFNADFLQWTGSKQILLAALTGMKKNASTTNSDVMVNAFSKTGQYNAGIGTEPANFTLTVTHSDLHALGGLTYAELLELEGGAGTRYTYGMDAAVFTNEGNASARSNYFTRRRAEAIQPLSDGYTEALKAYYDYFMKETNGKRLVDTDLLTLGLDLQSLTDANRAVAGRDGTGTQNAAGVAGMIYKIGPAILRSVLGEDYDTIRNFVKLCEESLEPLQFLEDIQYFYGGGANQMQGMVNLQEGLIVFAARELNHLNETEQRALLTAMDVVYDRLKSVSPKGKTMLEELYGPLYGFESDMASIETARASLLFAIDTQAAKRLKPILNKDVADNSLDGIRYYDVIRDELGNLTVDADGNFVYAADSIVLSGLWARFAANMEELRSLSPDAAGAVVSAEELAQYDALYDALLSEVFQRSLKSNTELKEIFAFFARLRYSGIAQENTDTLLNLIDEAKEKNAAFSAIYHQNKNSLSKDDLARVFGDYPTFIPNATDAILSVLGIRYGTQLDIAARLFEDGGDVDWNNVAIYREMLGGVDGRLRSAILGTVFYTDTMAAKYDIISKIDKQLADFMANGGFDQYPNAWETEYPTRPAMPNDAARNKAYIADHERLAQTMEAIDTLLTGDALSALGLSFDLSETLHGLVPTVLSDSIINAVVGLLYDKVLTKFEDVWAGLPSEQEITDPIATKLTINVASLHNVLTGKNYNGANAASSAGLEAMKTMRLYPDLLAEVLPDTFSEAKEALAALAPADPAKFKTYPSNIWNDPSIRDADGALNLKWGVDELEGDAKVERFKTAFAASMQGLWPLLASLLCGQTYTAYHPQVAAVSGMSGIISGDVTIDLFIKEGNHGFAEALTPVFEALLGTGDNCILTPAELENITTPRQLVDAIIDPLVEFIDKLADAPLSTITAALPNIAYAFSVDRILPLFNNLKLGIEYQP